MFNTSYHFNTDYSSESTTLLTGLRHYYDMEDGNDSVTSDAHNLTSYNGTTFGIGNTGNCAVFDGTNDYLKTLSYSSFFGSTTTPRTINMWIYPQSTGGAKIFAVTEDGEIYLEASAGTNAIRTRLVMKIDGAYEVAYSQASFYALDTWGMITYTLDMTAKQVKIYQNGVYYTTFTITGNALSYSNRQTYFATNVLGSSEYFTGKIDEAGFWNRVLTADEIKELYWGGNGNTYPFERD